MCFRELTIRLQNRGRRVPGSGALPIPISHGIKILKVRPIKADPRGTSSLPTHNNVATPNCKPEMEGRSSATSHFSQIDISVNISVSGW